MSTIKEELAKRRAKKAEELEKENSLNKLRKDNEYKRTIKYLNVIEDTLEILNDENLNEEELNLTIETLNDALEI